MNKSLQLSPTILLGSASAGGGGSSDVIGRSRGVVLNALTPQTVWKVDSTTVAGVNDGTGYAIGDFVFFQTNSAQTQMQASGIVMGVDGSGAITDFVMTGVGAFSADQTSSSMATTTTGSGTGAEFSFSCVQGNGSILSDIVSPQSGDTAIVLSDETHNGAMWLWQYSDVDSSGIFNWVPISAFGSAGAGTTANTAVSDPPSECWPGNRMTQQEINQFNTIAIMNNAFDITDLSTIAGYKLSVGYDNTSGVSVAGLYPTIVLGSLPDGSYSVRVRIYSVNTGSVLTSGYAEIECNFNIVSGAATFGTVAFLKGSSQGYYTPSIGNGNPQGRIINNAGVFSLAFGGNNANGGQVNVGAGLYATKVVEVSKIIDRITANTFDPQSISLGTAQPAAGLNLSPRYWIQLPTTYSNSSILNNATRINIIGFSAWATSFELNFVNNQGQFLHLSASFISNKLIVRSLDVAGMDISKLQIGLDANNYIIIQNSDNTPLFTTATTMYAAWSNGNIASPGNSSYTTTTTIVSPMQYRAGFADLSDQCNGATQTFTLPVLATSFNLFHNGICQKPGKYYSVYGTTLITTFDTPPAAGDDLWITY